LRLSLLLPLSRDDRLRHRRPIPLPPVETAEAPPSTPKRRLSRSSPIRRPIASRWPKTVSERTVADPYRWLENDVRNDPEVAEWVERQNAVTNAHLAQLPARAWFRQRIGELYDYERFSTPVKRGGRYFYTRNSGLQNQSPLYVREGLGGEPRLLIDPNAWADDGATALSDWRPSPDGSKLLYSVQDGGTDWRILRVLDVATGQPVGEDIRWAKFTGLAWVGEEGFLYSRFPEPEAGQDFQALNYDQAVYFHRLGTPQSEDQLVYATPEHRDYSHSARVTSDGRWAIVTSSVGTDARYEVRAIDLAARGEFGWATRPLVTGFEHAWSLIDGIGGTLWFARASAASAPSPASPAIPRRSTASPASTGRRRSTARRGDRRDLGVRRARAQVRSRGHRGRAALLRLEGRHAGADVHRPPGRHQRPGADAALRLWRVRHLADARFSRAAGVDRDGRRLAVANLRGGGEYGKAWHDAGTAGQQAERVRRLHRRGRVPQGRRRTPAPRLAMQGGSNGGLLVGAVVNQRPDLFGAGNARGRRDGHAALPPLFTAGATGSTTTVIRRPGGNSGAARLFAAAQHEARIRPTRRLLVTTADTDDRVVPGTASSTPRRCRRRRLGPGAGADPHRDPRRPRLRQADRRESFDEYAAGLGSLDGRAGGDSLIFARGQAICEPDVPVALQSLEL
jgi:hypothetical protein